MLGVLNILDTQLLCSDTLQTCSLDGLVGSRLSLGSFKMAQQANHVDGFVMVCLTGGPLLVAISRGTKGANAHTFLYLAFLLGGVPYLTF